MALRSPLLQVIRVLTLLNQFYSLRDLEKILGIPFQSLWRYLNLVSVPRRSTMDRILRRVENLRLLDRLLEEAMKGVEDLSLLSCDPRFLKLFSMVVTSDLRRDAVDVVVPLSLEAVPLATALSMEIGSPMCYLYSHEARGSICEHYIVAHYVSNTRELRFIAIPKRCLRPRSRVALVDSVVDDLAKVSTVVELLRRRGCVPEILIAIASESELQSLARRYGLRIRILRPLHG